MCQNLEFYKDVLFPGITTLAVVIGGFLAYKTYNSNNRQRRFEFFYAIFNKYLDDPRTKKIESLLLIEEKVAKKEKSDWTEEEKKSIAELENFPQEDKYYLLGLFEQVAIALNSKLIDKNAAFYMFGYFAIASWDSTYFWANQRAGEKDSPYWAVCKNFVEKMKKVDPTSINPENIKYYS